DPLFHVEHVHKARLRILDLNRPGSSGAADRATDHREPHLASGSALAVTVHRCAALSDDAIAVRERLYELGYRLAGIGPARHGVASRAERHGEIDVRPSSCKQRLPCGTGALS